MDKGVPIMHSSRFPLARTVAPLAVLSVAALALTGCIPQFGPAPSNAVGFDEIQSATVEITGQGTFIEPGTLDPSETAWHGSGFIIDSSGLAVTNNHVVVGAGTLNGLVGGAGGEEVKMRVLGASECLDLAVVQLDGENFPHFNWFDGEITTGLDVYSAGFPAGYADEFTLTRGIVSKADFDLDTQWASLGHVIEHDARIRGGNSGGPLVTADAQVIGVNYAGDDSLDYNFAIHRDVVQDAFDSLAAGERVSSIGINAQAWQNEDGSLWGVWVSSVEAGGPADAAGVEPGDLILKLGGVSVGDDGTLGSYCQVLDTHGSDGTLDIEIYRPANDSLYTGQVNGKEISVSGTGVFGGAATGGGGEFSGSFVSVTDDTNTIGIDVPAEWTDVDGASRTDDSGRTWASIAASTNLDGYFNSFSVAGMELFATDPSVAPSAALGMWDMSSQCTQSDAGDYDDGYYVGSYVEYDCSGALFAVLATQDYDKTATVVLLAQLITDTERSTVLEQMLNTFRLL